jgi:hypothetical protein
MRLVDERGHIMNLEAGSMRLGWSRKIDGSNPSTSTMIKLKNHWPAHCFVYRMNELHVNEKTGEIWINVGWHLPLSCDKHTLKKTLAVSAWTYADKFN